MTHTRVGAKQLGSHVHTAWWSGKSELTTHGKNGDLIFTVEEWQTVRRVLLLAPDILELKEELEP